MKKYFLLEKQYPNWMKQTKKDPTLQMSLQNHPNLHLFIPAGSVLSLADLCTSAQCVGRQDTVGRLVSGRTGGGTGRGAGAVGRGGGRRGSRRRVGIQWRTVIKKMKLIEGNEKN